MDIFEFEGNGIKNINKGSWVVLYNKEHRQSTGMYGTLYSYLVPKEKSEKTMNSHKRDFNIGDGVPTFELSFNTQEPEIRYTNKDDDVIPLALFRKFPQYQMEGYFEISQELTGYLELYHDTKNNKYISTDDNDDVIDVIQYSDDVIKIRKNFLDAYMCVRQCSLITSFVMSECLDTQMFLEHTNKSDELIYSMYSNSFNTEITIVGKRLFPCKPLTENNIDYRSQREYLDFIIAGDDVDNELYSCEPTGIYYNGEQCSLDLPNELTPIFFRKEVLNKYLTNCKTYKVSDNHVEKVGFWSLMIDNNQDNYVAVLLGDIGKLLSLREQLHWKSYNIAPEGMRVSNTFYDRVIMGRWCKSEQPTFELKNIKDRLNENWLIKFGFQLFKELNKKDEYCVSKLHPLTCNEQAEFDEQILYLTKIFIDSINESEIKKIVKDDSGKDLRGIKLFCHFLSENNLNVNFDILFNIQSLRSSGSAHRKSKNYEKSEQRLNVDNEDLISSYKKISEQLLNALSSLKTQLLKESDNI